MDRAIFFTAFLFACSPTADRFEGGVSDTGEAGITSDATPSFQFVDATPDVKPVDADSCEAPDMLVILDRSDSMSSLVGTQGTRISLAVSAIQNITAAPTDTALRFGFQTLPAIGGAECSTQLVVPIGDGHGAAISSAITTMNPQLDYGTPIGGALTSAVATLAQNKDPNRKQYVLLVTDGGECCSCNTNDYDVGVAQQLYTAGVETYVVGFGGDDDPVLLNDLACAGHTATNFATSCTCTNGACTASTSINAQTTPLYFKASDGTALKSALASIANQTCCGCNVPVN
ncbi:MAG TPA: vWA domain-containing protein [Polyangiaceae bacterium]|jgi:hypothetical protein|nr:vWA domain-containing protein [Polyangiaceae bacterium]